MKVILSTDEDTAEKQDIDEDEENIDEEEEDDEGGMHFEKDDVLLIYKALKNYKPVNDDEEMTHEMLVEQFEEMLIVDYKVKLPGVRW
jgi:hypothetical protein